MIGIARQVVILFYERYAVTATPSRRLTNERLVWKVAHVLLQILNLVRQQERVRHKAVVDWEKALQTTNYYTENVLFRKVLFQTNKEREG